MKPDERDSILYIRKFVRFSVILCKPRRQVDISKTQSEYKYEYKLTNNKTVIYLIALIISFSSCKKDRPICTANCVSININGNTILKTNNTALASVPVEVNWVKNPYFLTWVSYHVASGKTDRNGKFIFNVLIDTTFFRDYFLSVRVLVDTNYISVPGSGAADYSEKRFLDFNSNAFQDINFNFYPKTYLTIILHRTLSDNFNYFSVEHNLQMNLALWTILFEGHKRQRTQL